MKLNKFLFCVFAACLLCAGNSFAAICAWVDNGTTYKQNIQTSIKSGMSEKYLLTLDACCKADPGFCGKYATDDDGYYNLQLAAKYNRTNTLKYFLKYTDCAETVDRFRAASEDEDPGEFNALMFAIKNENPEMVMWLLHYGASPTAKNYKGRDAKFYVEQLDQTKDSEIVRLVKAAWNKAMGYSQNLINAKKKNLKESLSGEKLRQMLDGLKAKYNPFFG